MNLHALPEPLRPAPDMNILGAEVAALGREEAIDLLVDLLIDRRFTKVSFLNAHNANVAQVDAEFASALRDFLILPDGIGVDIAARLLYGRSFPANLNGTDFIPAFFQAVETPLRVALLGTRKESAEAAAVAFRRIAPQHEFVFVHDGYFGPHEEARIVERIGKLKPDVLLVAMGVPRQELWIARNMTSDHCLMPVAVGALLDFMSGSVPRAPAWVRRIRMEWVFRLLLEPRRLFARYVLGNPVFLARVMRQKLRDRGVRP